MGRPPRRSCECRECKPRCGFDTRSRIGICETCQRGEHRKVIHPPRWSA